MIFDQIQLDEWLNETAILLEQGSEPNLKKFGSFLQEIDLSLNLIDLIAKLDDELIDHSQQNYFSACLFLLEICIATVQTEQENGNKQADRQLNQLMKKLAEAIIAGKQSLSFWLPVLSVFYEVQIELSKELKDAYFLLVTREEEYLANREPDESVEANSLISLLDTFAHLSAFEIAEHFFSQSYAMPAYFFEDLILDLNQIPRGQEISLLTLTHPNAEVRAMALSTFNFLMKEITLSPVSLSRLEMIKHWYPATVQERFTQWIKIQRKKGVIYNQNTPATITKIKATEIDGTGAQGLFIHLKQNNRTRLCGILFKQNIGIKDVWITNEISVRGMANYYKEAFDDSVTLREVDKDYLIKMTSHFLALTLDRNEMPNLHLLEVQELLGWHFTPQGLNIASLVEQLSIKIIPFTPQLMRASLERSKSWPNNKRFTESWYIENTQVDKLVNRCCTYVDGTKVCDMKNAMTLLFEEFENHREKWLFHFLWTTLWVNAKPHKKEKLFEDSFFIAYAIYTGQPLASIPLMQAICRQTLINSMETMQERRSYLHRED